MDKTQAIENLLNGLRNGTFELIDLYQQQELIDLPPTPEGAKCVELGSATMVITYQRNDKA